MCLIYDCSSFLYRAVLALSRLWATSLQCIQWFVFGLNCSSILYSLSLSLHLTPEKWTRPAHQTPWQHDTQLGWLPWQCQTAHWCWVTTGSYYLQEYQLFVCSGTAALEMNFNSSCVLSNFLGLFHCFRSNISAEHQGFCFIFITNVFHSRLIIPKARYGTGCIYYFAVGPPTLPPFPPPAPPSACKF